MVRRTTARRGTKPPDAAELVKMLAAGRAFERWWPVDHAYHEREGGDWRDEVAIGTVLTQNAAWTQVERSLDVMKDARALSLASVAAMPAAQLAKLIRQAGGATRKTATLQELARLVAAEGGMDRLAASVEDDPDPVRTMLLEVHGIGEETADAIVAFALDGAVFVVDAYARRILSRVGIPLAGRDGRLADPLRVPSAWVARWFRAGLGGEPTALRRAHAVLVDHAKNVCRPTPRCEACVLAPRCATGRAQLGLGG